MVSELLGLGRPRILILRARSDLGLWVHRTEILLVDRGKNFLKL